MGNFLGFSSMRVGVRLAVGFGLLIALLIGLTVTGVNRVSHINTGLRTIGDVNSVKQRYAINFRGSVHDRAIALRDVILEPKEQVQAQLDLIKKLADNYAKSAGPLDTMFAGTDVDGEERAALARIKEVEAQALPLTAQVIELRLADKGEEGLKLLLEKARPAYVDWLASINKLIDLEEAKNKTESANARDGAQGFAMLMIVLSALAILLAGFIGWTITLSIVQPIRKASQAARTMATGDMTLQIETTGHNDEIGEVLQALAELRSSLVGVLGNVRQGAENVDHASGEIAQGNHDLSARTESQATALQATAGSMDSLGSTVRQNADNARQANQLALNASRVAVQGGEVVDQVVETMKGINESSQKISDIISVIDGIAFQTNILALNAAVEAARAGEQGRGFAVVASEVRSLAGRSANAAKEIKQLISASVDRVGQGTVLADKAGATMGEVVTAIRRVTDIMGEISAASSEQSSGVAQVGDAVTQMDHSTQQNAALVEEMAAAAGSLKTQAQELVQAVAVFKLGSEGHVSAPRTKHPVPAPARTVARTPTATRTPALKNPVKLDAPKPANAKPVAAKSAASAGAADDGDWAAF